VSRYEQRLAEDKAKIRKRILVLGRTCSAAVRASMDALLAGDRAAAYRLVLDDLPINRESRSIDAACHGFVARHLPSAAHLRFVSSVMRMNVGLERVGDYAAGICRHAVQLERAPSGRVADEMRTMVERTQAMMEDALSAFEQDDAELARETKPVAKSLQVGFDSAFNLVTNQPGIELVEGVRWLSVFNKLERVTDQAKNICEDTLFALTGETKPPKQYRILFVDARNSLLSPLAEMLARKAFPVSGRYESAGYRPADALSEELSSLAMDMGLDAGGLAPTALNTKTLSKFHVIVWLNGEPDKHLELRPFQTVLLHWDLPKLADADSGDVRKQLREISQALSNQISELMDTMLGENAG
jgi:phosphate transport system protein